MRDQSKPIRIAFCPVARAASQVLLVVGEEVRPLVGALAGAAVAADALPLVPVGVVETTFHLVGSGSRCPTGIRQETGLSRAAPRRLGLFAAGIDGRAAGCIGGLAGIVAATGAADDSQQGDEDGGQSAAHGGRTVAGLAPKQAIAVAPQPWQGVIVGRKGKLRASPPAADQPVVWRGGVHMSGTPIWCDARRARELCFVSRADRIPASQHGQIIATAETLALLARQGRRPDAASVLAVPPGRPFSLGTLRLELFRSGTAVGAASLSVDLRDRRVVYAGSVNPAGGGLGGAADQRSCTVLVVDAHYGDPRFRFPPVDQAVEEAAALCRRVCGAGGALVLLVTSALKGLDVAHRLDGAGVRTGCELLAHRSIHHAAQKLRSAGLDSPPVRRFAASRVQPGQVLMWPTGRRVQLDRVGLPGGSAVALVSGAAADRDALGRARAGHGIAWSSQADHATLCRYIEESGAASVHLIGRFAEQMAEELAGRGLSARPLGPPVQMSLFA